MEQKTYRLLSGWSPNGDAVHPVDHVDGYVDLKTAKAAAGTGLEWPWVPVRNAWRAETGYESAAGIEPRTRQAGISVTARMMA